jgi:hypothetical protein
MALMDIFISFYAIPGKISTYTANKVGENREVVDFD